jgi:hypothetical protein
MSTRTITTIIIAVILVILVMAVSAGAAFIGWVDETKFETRTDAQFLYGGAQNMKIMDLTGDGQDDLFVQDLSNVVILDTQGNPVFQKSYDTTLVSSMGDINADGVEDALAFFDAPNGEPLVDLIVKAELVNQLSATEFAPPSRIAVVQFNSGPQIILGDMSGQLLALDPNGKQLWRAEIGFSEEVRGLDDVKVDGVTYLAAANRDGSVALFDERGALVWSYNVKGGLRRLRAYDLNGDGVSEVLLGGESGQFIVLDASSGTEIRSDFAGQPVTEIRPAELNGDPVSQEVVAGGKNGGVWAYTWDGQRLWAASVSDKVMEIAGYDVDRDGAEEVLIGDDSGGLYLFYGSSGERENLLSLSGTISRIDVGSFTDSHQVAISDNSALYLYALEIQSAPPLRFTPLLVGLLISAVILVAAWFIATNPPKPKVKMAIEDQSAESLRAQRRMLKESIADVERLKDTGEVSPDAYLHRMKDLRGQLADNETAMRTAGVAFTPETFACPHCGGSLLLGVDRCDYCGQVVIT